MTGARPSPDDFSITSIATLSTTNAVGRGKCSTTVVEEDSFCALTVDDVIRGVETSVCVYAT